MQEPAEARPQDVLISLTWHATREATLTGELVVRNISDPPVRLSGKPSLQPLGIDGEPLEAQTIVSMELQVPGYVDLGPDEDAAAPVAWAGWNGPEATGDVLVNLCGGASRVAADGPHQPQFVGPPNNLTSSWFRRRSKAERY